MPTPTPDYESLVYARIWALLEADTIWAAAVEPRNREKFDELVGVEDPSATQRSDNEFPHASLRLVAGNTNMFGSDVTFETFADAGPAQWTEQGTLLFVLTVISESLKLGESTSLGSQSRNALRRGGPRMGGRAGLSLAALPWALMMGLRWSTDQIALEDPVAGDSENDTGGVFRLRTQIRIEVRTVTSGSTLIGD